MIELVAAEALRRGYRKVGVLATPTTIKYDLYGKALCKNKIGVFYSGDGTQKLHESIIRKLVAGEKVISDVQKIVRSTEIFIKENNLDGIILGCTELPLVFPKKKFDGRMIDSMDILADKLLERYYN